MRTTQERCGVPSQLLRFPGLSTCGPEHGSVGWRRGCITSKERTEDEVSSLAERARLSPGPGRPARAGEEGATCAVLT